jgi:hypothetical protein
LEEGGWEGWEQIMRFGEETGRRGRKKEKEREEGKKERMEEGKREGREE